jgi:uncharacterized membrane protein YeaQ/YmgE (transglycosylase-associated protein family)
MDILGVSADYTTLAIWAGAGIVAGALLLGRRPLGFIGDLIVGILGGALGGWGADYAAANLGFDANTMVEGWVPESYASYAPYVSTFATAFVGALVLLIIIRLLKR